MYRRFLLLFGNQAVREYEILTKVEFLWLKCCSHIASTTSFTLLSSIDIFSLSSLGSSSILTLPSRKRLALLETVLWSTVKSLRAALKTLWISIEFLPGNFLILRCYHWSSVTAAKTCAGLIALLTLKVTGLQHLAS